MCRMLCCALGRPLSLRDEGFDVPFPNNVNEDEIQIVAVSPDTRRMTTMTPSIRLFELMQILSEIKLHLYRVRQGQDRFPWPDNLDDFRQKTLQRLLAWRSEIPGCTTRPAVRSILDLRFHQAVLLLFRPSPAFPQCSGEALDLCVNSAKDTLKILDAQQRFGRLAYSFLHVHDTFLSGLTLLFGLLVLPPDSIPATRFAPSVRSCSSVLAALGDVWVEARKARTVFERLADLVGNGGANVAFGDPSTILPPATSFDRLSAPLASSVDYTQYPNTDEWAWLTDTFNQSEPLSWDAIPEANLAVAGNNGGITDLSTNSAIQSLLDSFTGQFPASS